MNGVPQGPSLGPALINIFVSVMDSGIEGTLSKLAADTKLCGVVSMLQGRDAIQMDMDRFERYTVRVLGSWCVQSQNPDLILVDPIQFRIFSDSLKCVEEGDSREPELQMDGDALNPFSVLPVFSLGTAPTQVQDLTIGLDFLSFTWADSSGFLDGIPSIQHVDCTTQLDASNLAVCP
ncbi:hypothetical protein DUI87_07656 [Hirundo rustica rustica]|uniref:Reverse transcriptase domain-containing protein n=1 Tax=Hirundo rustica rustica TaxID=333673 RepID=A0A3M0KVL8_HIRRU|nr:hypothetical protein DUI87_07656 [Hirundo rustica rustica]